MEYQFISLELEITAFFYLFDLFYNVLYLLVCVYVCGFLSLYVTLH